MTIVRATLSLVLNWKCHLQDIYLALVSMALGARNTLRNFFKEGILSHQAIGSSNNLRPASLLTNKLQKK